MQSAPPRAASSNEALKRSSLKVSPLARQGEMQPPTLVPPISRGGLSRGDARKLEAVLDELVECRKLIDAALGDTSSAAA